MPFSNEKINIHPIILKKTVNQINQREEYGSFLAHQPQKKIPQKKKRASVFTASLTIEAAMTIPLFFIALVCLLYMLEIMAIQTSVKSAAHSTSKIIVKEIYTVPVVFGARAESLVVDAVGKERLDRSIVVNGSTGIHCYKSWVEPNTGILNLVVEYEVKLPFPQFGIPSLKYKETVKMKGWTGYVKSDFSNKEGEMVYVTETGNVYHKDYQCTHLDLSIHTATVENISNLRNLNQGIYHSCEKCVKSNVQQGTVYITNTGDRYHSTLGCSGLKRSIYKVPLSEVQGKGACLRCGQ